jgi:hypothetical protein
LYIISKKKKVKLYICMNICHWKNKNITCTKLENGHRTFRLIRVECWPYSIRSEMRVFPIKRHVFMQPHQRKEERKCCGTETSPRLWRYSTISSRLHITEWRSNINILMFQNTNSRPERQICRLPRNKTWTFQTYFDAFQVSLRH